MKLIIDAPDEIVKKGFEEPLTDEERQILIRAIGNGILYEEPQGKLLKSIREEISNVPSPDSEQEYYTGVKQGLKLAEAIINSISAEGGVE